jgi:hypothetical protein
MICQWYETLFDENMEYDEGCPEPEKCLREGYLKFSFHSGETFVLCKEHWDQINRADSVISKIFEFGY